MSSQIKENWTWGPATTEPASRVRILQVVRTTVTPPGRDATQAWDLDDVEKAVTEADTEEDLKKALARVRGLVEDGTPFPSPDDIAELLEAKKERFGQT